MGEHTFELTREGYIVDFRIESGIGQILRVTNAAGEPIHLTDKLKEYLQPFMEDYIKNPPH